MSEQTDTTYNGWTNYPTWAVNLWLANDEGLYRQTLEEVAIARKKRGQFSTERLVVADRLKDWVRDDLSPDLGASIAADMLGYAFDLVNWLEIADAWLEDVDA